MTRRSKSRPPIPSDQPGEAQALSLRYHFSERYSAQEDPQKPETLTQYRVGSRDTLSVVREKPQGAPDRAETSVRSVYTERVVKLEKGSLADVVRRYDEVDYKTTLPIRPVKTKLVEGMTILYQLQKNRPTGALLDRGSWPQARRIPVDFPADLFAGPFDFAYRPSPVRVGDRWTVPRLAAWALVGDEPENEDYDLNAELIEVRKSQTGSALTAVIGVKGTFVFSDRPTAVNAQLDFTFEPAVSPPAPSPLPIRRKSPRNNRLARTRPKPGPSSGVIEARGYISKIRMAIEFSVAMQGNDGRFKQISTRRMLLERRTDNQAEGGNLSVPAPLPTETMENSWLSYEDAQGRFHFRHPQELRVNASLSEWRSRPARPTP